MCAILRQMRKFASLLPIIFIASGCGEIKQPDSNTHIQAAEAALHQGNYQRAKAEAEYLAKLDNIQRPMVPLGLMATSNSDFYQFPFHLSMLAQWYHLYGFDTEAELLFRKALSWEEVMHGKQVANRSDSMQELRKFLWEVGKTDEAKALDSRILSSARNPAEGLSIEIENLQREGDSDKAEALLLKNIKVVLQKEKLDYLEDTKEAVSATSGTPKGQYSMSMEALRALGVFYHKHSMPDKERPVVIKMLQLDALRDQCVPIQQLTHWQQIIDIDLRTNQLQAVLSDCEKMKQLAESLLLEDNDLGARSADRHIPTTISNDSKRLASRRPAGRDGALPRDFIQFADAIKNEVNSLIAVGQKKSPPVKPISKRDLGTLLTKGNVVIVLCRISGWRLQKDGTLSVNGVKTPPNSYYKYAIVTPIHALIGVVPLKTSQIYLGEKWDEPDVLALARINANKQDFLIIGTGPDDSCITNQYGYESEYNSDRLQILSPAYFRPGAILPANKTNLQTIEQVIAQRKAI